MELARKFFLLGALVTTRKIIPCVSLSVGGSQPAGLSVSYCTSGVTQSPIDIIVSNCIPRDFPHEAFLDNILFTNDIVYENNCETVKITLFNKTLKPMVQGGALENMTYIIDNIHFHWGTIESEGCEHTINGRHFPMEAHLVVYKSTEQDFDTALANKNTAVLSFLFTLEKYSLNTALYAVIAAVMEVQQPYSSYKTSGASLAFMRNYIGGGFYSYKGSLTTPPCTEGVLWMVYKKMVPIGQFQLMEFHRVLANDGKELRNWRRTMPLNSRPVWQSCY